MNWARIKSGIFLTVAMLSYPLMVTAAQKKLVSGHVPAVVAHGTIPAITHLAGTNQLRLAIGLPLRNASALTNLLRELYDPASPQFHHFLTPAEFTARFGPTPQDYAAVLHFAHTNGFTVTATHPNRLLVDVVAKATQAEGAFHVRLNSYRHPKEPRNFFAPATEPMVDAALPVFHVSGLDNYSLPHPKVQIHPADDNRPAMPKGGSSPGGGYMGNDLRKAYVPGTPLTGAGQNIGLLQFDAFYGADITNYATTIGVTNPPHIVVLPVDGGVATPGPGVVEVSLDIEMSLAMAPGVSNIYVYEAPNDTGFFDDILNRMADDNLAPQLSCSWGGGGPNPMAETIFQQMAAQGQTFFNASGDFDAFTGAILFPSESDNITQVGGTTLITDTNGNYLSETVWNWGGGQGSSGGISTTVAIPSWQLGIDMTTNQGSTSWRNIPDVALTGDNVFVMYGNGSVVLAGGTSCAAPLWAGFMALVNEQAATATRPPAGFINPAVYAIGTGTNYAGSFHDTLMGDNFWTDSPTNFPAAPGYDLCTGWGTPAGQSLMNALAGPPEALGILPDASFIGNGTAGGPFSPAAQSFTLTNYSAAPLYWLVSNTASWLDLSTNGGTLAASDQIPVTVSLNAAANSLPPGTYVATIGFTNETSGIFQSHLFTLQVADPLLLLNATNLAAQGPVAGPFMPSTSTFTLTNQGIGSLVWALGGAPPWLAVSITNGTLAPKAFTNVNLSFDRANTLPSGAYLAVLAITNLTWAQGQSVTLQVNIGQSVVKNGGFETGDFSDWTLAGDTQIGSSVYNAVATDNDFAQPVDIVHSGNFGAFLGQGGHLATLTQTLPTTAGQLYQLSFWVDNPVEGDPQYLIARWNGAEVLNFSNPPALLWTNCQFLVTAGSIDTDLQFAVQNDTNYFGLDGVSVTPVPPLIFQNVDLNGGDLKLVWYSLAGLDYQVQITTNLAPAYWQSLGNIMAGTNVCSLVDTNAINSAGRRFYRLVLLP